MPYVNQGGATTTLAASQQPQTGGQPGGAYNQQVASNLGNPGFLSQMAGLLGGAAAPAIGGAQLQAAQAAQQAGLAGPGLALTEQYLGQSTGYDIANALLNEEGLGLQSQALASQIGTSAAQQGIEQQQYGLQQQTFPQQLAEAQQGYQTQLQAQQGAAGAAGATNTVGNRTAQTNLAQGYAWQQADIYRNQALAQLAQQSEQVGYGGQQTQQAIAQRQLGLAAQQAGIPVKQAISQLTYGLGQAGIQADPTQFLAQMATADTTAAGDYAAVLSQAGATTGLGPNFLNFGG